MFLTWLARWVVAGPAADWRTFSSCVQPATQLRHHVMKHRTAWCTGVLEHVTSFDDINDRYSHPGVHFTGAVVAVMKHRTAWCTGVPEHVTSFDDINDRYGHPGVHFTGAVVAVMKHWTAWCTGVLEHVTSFDDINDRYAHPGVHFTGAVVAVVFSQLSASSST